MAKTATAAKPRKPLPPPIPSKTPAELLIELGRELHGEHWIGPTSRDLNIAHRTMANWVSGKSRLREGPILDALRLLVNSHREAVARARKLSAAVETNLTATPNTQESK
jgi:hypothetical protein